MLALVLDLSKIHLPQFSKLPYTGVVYISDPVVTADTDEGGPTTTPIVSWPTVGHTCLHESISKTSGKSTWTSFYI